MEGGSEAQSRTEAPASDDAAANDNFAWRSPRSWRPRRRSRPSSRVDAALSALTGRAEEIEGHLTLDGEPATLRELVIAAAACGITIPYPNINPLTKAYHTGPAILGGAGREKRKPGRRRP